MVHFERHMLYHHSEDRTSIRRDIWTVLFELFKALALVGAERKNKRHNYIKSLMHTWHLPRIMGQSTFSFQYPACREHDWKVTWSFERHRRIAWFLMIGLPASTTIRGSFKPACKHVQRTCTLSCWLSASQNLLALEAPSDLLAEWKTEPFSGTWRNCMRLWCPHVFRTCVHCGIFRILHECISLLLRNPVWTHEPSTLFNQATHCSMLEKGKMTSNLMPSSSFDTYHQQGQSRSLVGAIGHRPGSY